MQIRAISRRAIEVQKGGDDRPAEIMIPLVGNRRGVVFLKNGRSQVGGGAMKKAGVTVES